MHCIIQYKCYYNYINNANGVMKMKLTAKHLTKEEMAKCNVLLNSVDNVNSCLYQTIEKNVFEFINAKEAMLRQEKNFEQFKNNQSLFNQVSNALNKASQRFANAQMLIA